VYSFIFASVYAMRKACTMGVICGKGEEGGKMRRGDKEKKGATNTYAHTTMAQCYFILACFRLLYFESFLVSK
jgi:hypothetical protein